MLNKRLINTGEAAAAAFDPLQNFETVTYTGNGGTQKITGYIRKGAAFNGSSSQINTNASLLASTTWSVSLWFNTNDKTNNQSIFSQYVSGDATRFFVWINNSGTQIRITLADNDYNNSFSISNNTWHHLVITKDSSGFNTYLDNGTPTANSDTASMASSTIDFRIGSNGGSAPFFDGKIDQVRIFDKALSSAEATTLYNETYDSSTKSTTDIFGDGSGVALYELDDSANDTGGTYNGTATNVNFLGMAFQPDLVWIKHRNGSGNSHGLWDSVRGASNWIGSNVTSQEVSGVSGVSSFDSNGFTIGTHPAYNTNNNTHVAWCWKAGGAAVSNTDGTITSTVSANQDAGFSIVKYTKSGTSGTMGHGLSSAPELIMEKRTDGAAYWNVRVEGVTANNQTIYLNESAGVSTHPSLNLWSTPTTSVFGYDSANAGAGDYVAYCFHSVTGVQDIGTYTGSGTAGKEVTGLGFSPRFVMIKDSTQAGHWIIHSKPPTTTNPSVYHLRANLSAQEDGGTNEQIDFDDDGFTLNGTGGNVNTLNDVYIYLAIA